ncbi:uncharacterized protein CDAR_297551 [Caerostris darwini]|uniref:Uncharacterized protein n=1 Tax=Caerostris darwini TaxID=1538125 RepID=A0AAV4PQ96_9ARAC|nr:uncharacterized protein CDAR_297551 [Caerostris darwini]
MTRKVMNCSPKMSCQNDRWQMGAGFFQKMLFLWICVLLFSAVDAKKIQYASAKECDRYSLDAVYYERFKLVTQNVFKDCREFVNKVSDLLAESLTTLMAELPDRDASDNQEKKLFEQFKTVKKSFSSRVKKTHKNITTSWETLVANHFDLMYDNGKSSLKDYLGKVLNMTDSYSESRKVLDTHLGSFVSFVKGLVRDGLQGINMATEDALKGEEAKRNATRVNQPDSEDEEEESEEDRRQKKKLEIAEMVGHGFLGKITIEVIKQKIDLFKPVETNPEDRESVLDDLLFDVLMIKNRMRAIIHDDIPKDKGNIDLARRSVYTYWADLAENMYADRIKARQSTAAGGDNFTKSFGVTRNNFWIHC